MPEILVSRDAEQAAARIEAGRELKVGEIGAAVAAAQPVLLLGEIVMADAGAAPVAQRLLGGAVRGSHAKRCWQMHRDAIAKSTHRGLSCAPSHLPSGGQ